MYSIFFKLILVLSVIFILYLLAIMPRVFHKPDKSLFQKKLFAHRGLHNVEKGIPENSVTAFREAVKEGFGIEFDVHVTKDRIPVVFHDFSLKRMCGCDKAIEDCTFEELQQLRLLDTKEHIPSLQEVLSVIDARVPLIIEIKSEITDVSECSLIDEMLRKYKGAYCIESFNPCVLWWYRIHNNRIVRGQLATNYRIEGVSRGPQYVFLTHLLLNFITKPDFIAYNHRFGNEPSRRICRSLYRNTMAAWTVKSREEWKRLSAQYDVFIFEGFVPER